MKVAPARTKGTSSGALMRCQRAWAASSSLYAMARAALREAAPLVTPVLSLTVEKVDSIGVGYSVARRPVEGGQPIWFGGGRLGRDLALPALRPHWDCSGEAPVEAATSWTRSLYSSAMRSNVQIPQVSRATPSGHVNREELAGPRRPSCHFCPWPSPVTVYMLGEKRAAFATLLIVTVERCTSTSLGITTVH